MDNHFTKKEQIAILIIGFIVILGLGFKFILHDTIYDRKEPLEILVNDSKEDIVSPPEKEEDTPDLIMVHIGGQVYNPGVFELDLGTRVIDAVELAGGLKKEADIDRINLARKLSDEEKIYIPKIGEENLGEEYIDSELGSSKGTGKININRCSKEELISLPGIGQVIADRILEYRDSKRFEKIEDLMDVSGVGTKKFEGLKDLITTN